jgi:hypothetical protein
VRPWKKARPRWPASNGTSRCNPLLCPITVRISPAADREIRKLDRPIQKRISEKLDELQKEPRPRGLGPAMQKSLPEVTSLVIASALATTGSPIASTTSCSPCWCSR